MSVHSRPRVVIADSLAENGLALLREQLDVVTPADDASLLASIAQSDALVVRSRTTVTEELLDVGSRLQLVARAGVGVDNVDVGAATDRGILVINAPLGNIHSTAEHTVGLIFALARRIPAADLAVRAGSWKSGYEGMQLAGKTLGLVGIGKVGQIVATLARGIGMDVVAYDPFIPEEAWSRLPVKRAELVDLLRISDMVSVHVPLSPETRNLLGVREIAEMKAGAYLINCARGGLVDESALADALSAGHLAGAALDVFTQEPLKDSPLLSAPNIILTPHVAASTREAQTQVAGDIAEQVLNFFNGKPVAFPVNPSVLRKV